MKGPLGIKEKGGEREIPRVLKIPHLLRTPPRHLKIFLAKWTALISMWMQDNRTPFLVFKDDLQSAFMKNMLTFSCLQFVWIWKSLLENNQM